MKKALTLLFVLAVSASFSACQSEDTHGVIINRGGFLGGLFGSTPEAATPAPIAPSATPRAAPASNTKLAKS